jgi:hypothetical protein
MTDKTQYFSIAKILKSAIDVLHTNQKNLRVFWLVNFVYLGIFNFIDQGFSNPLSILWLAGYYVYWCVFFRVYYHKKPYFDTSTLLGSIAPSSKMFFMTIFAVFLLVILPYLPLLMGFNDKYLTFFEKYMEALQNIEANILNQAIFAAILLFLSPIIICRPFFAWLDALRGLNGSLRKAFHKTRGNNFRFILLMLILDTPCVLAAQIDRLIDAHDWFEVAFNSIFFLYFNLVFAKLYDFFYRDENQCALTRQEKK